MVLFSKVRFLKHVKLSVCQSKFQFDKCDCMKKLIALILPMICVLCLAGCNTKSMNYIISNKPSVTGIVEEVHDDYIIMYSETAEDRTVNETS